MLGILNHSVWYSHANYLEYMFLMCIFKVTYCISRCRLADLSGQSQFLVGCISCLCALFIGTPAAQPQAGKMCRQLNKVVVANRTRLLDPPRAILMDSGKGPCQKPEGRCTIQSLRLLANYLLFFQGFINSLSKLISGRILSKWLFLCVFTGLCRQ